MSSVKIRPSDGKPGHSIADEASYSMSRDELA